ncbi:MAG: helix-turn-helix domain-containing protein [Acidimicrobiia bacterium]
MAALLTTRDVQERISVDKSTIYRMAETGRIPAVKIGRQWRFPADQLDAWLLERTRGAPTARPAPDRPGGVEASVPTIQAVTDLAAELLGVTVLVTAVDGTPITRASNPCGFFEQVQRAPGAVAECTAEWRALGADPDLTSRFAPSPFGFLCARTFVRIDDRLVAMVIAGGVAPPRWPPVPDRLAELAGRLGIDRDTLGEHVHEVFHLEPVAQQRVLDALPRVGALLSHLACDRQWVRSES